MATNIKYKLTIKIPFIDFEVGTIFEFLPNQIKVQNSDKNYINTIYENEIRNYIKNYINSNFTPYIENPKFNVGDYVKYFPNEKKKQYNLGIIQKSSVNSINRVIYYIQPFGSNNLVEIEEKYIEKIENYYFFISSSGNVQFDYIKDNTNMNIIEYRKRMNNYFKTKEEATSAIKNLLPFQYKINKN